MVWIRIPRLPLELYNDKFLKRIGSSLRTMLNIDRLASTHDRDKYARICVEHDLDKQLTSHIVNQGEKLFLEYEVLHAICFRCEKYRHKKDQCREGALFETISNKEQQLEAPSNLNKVTEIIETSGEVLGEWRSPSLVALYGN